MCEFIHSKHILPGYGCCSCRSYNGLQRQQCRSCGRQRCAIVIPPGISQCACGFAFLEVDRQSIGGCPVCDAPLAVAGAPA